MYTMRHGYAISTRDRHAAGLGAARQVQPGARLEEIPLAEKLGVSRTPVRAALATLGNEGLLEHLPKRGYTVRAYDIGEIVAAYEVRAALEGLACRQAAMRGLSNDAVATLRNCLDEGDRILGKGVLLPDDHMPYQQVNITLHNSILEAAGNPGSGASPRRPRPFPTRRTASSCGKTTASSCARTMTTTASSTPSSGATARAPRI